MTKETTTTNMGERLNRMRLIALTATSVLLVGGVAACSSGASNESSTSSTSTFSANNVDIAGTWEQVEASRIRNGERLNPGSWKVTIYDVSEGLFKLRREVDSPVPAVLHPGKPATIKETLESVGAINPDGTFTMTDEEPGTVVQGWVLSENEIQLVLTESGDQQIARQVKLQRSASDTSSDTPSPSN